VGNSIGSLVSLAVAARRPVKGVLLVNCAGGMNSKFASKEEGLPEYVRAIAGFAGSVIDALLKFRPLAGWLFDNVRSPENVHAAWNPLDARVCREYVSPRRASREAAR